MKHGRSRRAQRTLVHTPRAGQFNRSCSDEDSNNYNEIGLWKAANRTGDFVGKRWIYGRRHGETHPEAENVPGIIVYRFLAPLIFSNAEAFTKSGEALLIEAAQEGPLPHTLVVDFEAVFSVDDAGAAALKSLFDYAQRYGVDLILARVHSETRELLHLSGVLDEIGEHRIYRSVRSAVDAATTSGLARNERKPEPAR